MAAIDFIVRQQELQEIFLQKSVLSSISYAGQNKTKKNASIFLLWWSSERLKKSAVFARFKWFMEPAFQTGASAQEIHSSVFAPTYQYFEVIPTLQFWWYIRTTKALPAQVVIEGKHGRFIIFPFKQLFPSIWNTTPDTRQRSARISSEIVNTRRVMFTTLINWLSHPLQTRII